MMSQTKAVVCLATVTCLLVLLQQSSGQECTPDFCDKVNMKCRGIVCPQGYVYSPRGDGLCDCCPSCTRVEDTTPSCEKDICSRVRLRCDNVLPCPEGSTFSPYGGGYCGCCPSCVKTEEAQNCEKDTCLWVKFKCDEVLPCPEGSTFSPKGGGYCGCCPSCIINQRG